MSGQPKIMSKILLMDIGNTNIKYAWYTYPNDIADLHVLRTSIDSVADLLTQADACFFCSVRDEIVNSEIARLCLQHAIYCEQVTTQTSQFGLTNAYKKVSNMGADRWLAMLGVGALTNNNYLVIDAGTAITCDFVVNKQHKGGWIACGLNLARESVVKNTRRVFDDKTAPYQLGLGVDTPDCVAQGALAQLTGMLHQAISMMRISVLECVQSDKSAMDNKKFDVFMSGGDAPVLINAYGEYQQRVKSQQQIQVPINYIENLVLVGLARVAHEKASTNV